MSSRESDSAYPPPRGATPGRRTADGADAYPSGTPPYGTGLPGAAAFAHGRSDDPFGTATQGAGLGGQEAAADDVPKTETTLTTRVRINIPGSRPIPPVVVRSPVKNEEPGPGPGAPGRRTEGSGSPVLGVMDAGTAQAPVDLSPERQEGGPAGGQGRPDGASESESTGAWFRPRQKSRGDGAPDGAPQPAPQTAQASAQATPRTAPQGAPRPAAGAPRPAPQGGPQATTPGPRGPVPGERRGAPRPTGTPASPFAGGPEGGAPQDPFAAPQDPFAAPPQARPDAGGGQRPAGRFAADPFAGPAQGAPGAPGAEPRRAPADPFGPAPVQENPFRTGPADPFAAGRAAGAAQPEPEDTQVGGFEPIRDDAHPGGSIPGVPTASLFGSAPPAADPFAGPADPFAAPGAAPAGGPFAAPADPFAPGSAPAAADPFGGPYGGAPAQADPFGGPFGGAAPDRGRPAPAAAEPAPAPAPEPAPPKAESAEPAPKRRGKARKLAGYAVGGLIFAGAAAYGTGLMLNQADIPKGTTVLGTDIGGDTRDQAVSALDESVAKTGKEPIKLKLGSQALTLDPATAGLSFDTTGTVDGLTKHSYNPVEVIGSLAGGSKAVAPEVKVDQSKLKAALDELAAKSGQGLKEGYVRFTETGQTEVVPGKPGQGLDSAAAAAQVEQAYRNRAAGLPEEDVALTLTAAKPKVGEDALKAAAASLGKQVLNGNVTLKAGKLKWDFGKLTASRALTLAPDASGKVVLTWDLDKLDAALNGVFDKAKTRKNGALAPITPQDVADGIASVLDKSGRDRVFTFPA
ncbi:peptidoglycan binding domain-containing protein [Streptomyces sp. NRRL B-24484]|uniref:peptidoglycan binding domain-containing protein n=1 Tax=Streptomyces sp. NRRL B-24484 TaxID=1463833 RepID=UPI0004BF9CF1|nr:peptidoglycan binding domain-containing protein [Streptomyces sp. NRRL B-24484]